MEKGYIHVYTGDGKGKTTAAFGLAVRAAGAGKKVFIGQFVKSMAYSELKAMILLKDYVDVELLGHGCFITKDPDPLDIAAAKAGLEKIREVFQSGRYQVVILDEITIALFYHLLTLEEVLALMDEKPYEVELVLTGRYTPDAILERADLITEMKEIKHYYTQGVLSREGIDR